MAEGLVPLPRLKMAVCVRVFNPLFLPSRWDKHDTTVTLSCCTSESKPGPSVFFLIQFHLSNLSRLWTETFYRISSHKPAHWSHCSQKRLLGVSHRVCHSLWGTRLSWTWLMFPTGNPLSLPSHRPNCSLLHLVSLGSGLERSLCFLQDRVLFLFLIRLLAFGWFLREEGNCPLYVTV